MSAVVVAKCDKISKRIKSRSQIHAQTESRAKKKAAKKEKEFSFVCFLEEAERKLKIFLQFSADRARLTFEKIVVVKKLFFYVPYTIEPEKSGKKDLEEKEKKI
jgi:hypothetical protein